MKVRIDMSQLSLNQTIQSLVTNPESDRKSIFFRNSQSRAKNRTPTPKGNEENISVCTAGESSRVHKLGYLPSYLKRETKSSLESDFFIKYKKFKIAKKDLIQQQTNLKQHFEQLRVLKEKLKRFGGRDVKIESLELIEFTGGGNDNRCGDGDHDVLDIFKHSNCTNNQIHEFEQLIQKIHGQVKDCLFKLIESNSEVLKQIQESGTQELKDNSQKIFLNMQDYVESVISDHNMSTQYLLENLQRLRIPQENYEGHSAKDTGAQDEIDGLKKAVQSLEVQGKMLRSEIDVKNQEIEYLKNKESCRNNSNMNELKNEMHSEIQAQKDVITDYSAKVAQLSKQQEINEEHIRQLEYKVLELNVHLQDNLLKHEADLTKEREKCQELGRMLEEAKITNENLLKSGSNFESVSNKLTTVNEDIKELQFKVCKREKQIQNLKHILNSESNKAKEYDNLLLKYDELRQQEHCKSQEIHQLKEKLILRTDTINSQILTISELKKMLMTQGAGIVECSKDISVGPLQEEQTSKFTKQERLIEKLENNKIRSNVLRDQLLDRISMLEKENEDMKAQIRKFHEDFTINRFMYDEQRRKKRLTEILVKQYQN